MKAPCTNITAVWFPEEEPSGYVFPKDKKVLSYTVYNKGEDSVLIDETEVLNQDEYFPVAHHAGYYFQGVIDIKPITSVKPPVVHIRMTVEL